MFTPSFFPAFDAPCGLWLQERQQLLKDVRVAKNKGCVRAFERLSRDLAKRQEDDRGACDDAFHIQFD